MFSLKDIPSVSPALRPDLAPRDRSLVTVSALIASGQVAQITFHLNKAMDNGLTKGQVSEVLTQLAFYAGWPNAMSAVPVVKDVLEKRSRKERFFMVRATCASRRARARESLPQRTRSFGSRLPASAGLTFGPTSARMS